MTESAARKPYVSPGQRALEWWRETCEATPATNDPRAKRRDPAIRARLRRCRSNTEAAAIPAAIQLAQRLGALRRDDRDIDGNYLNATLGLARVLASVTTNVDDGPMRRAGWKHFPGQDLKSQDADSQPLLGDARFKRLLAVKPGEEQVTAFSRLVDLIDGRVNVAELARDFLEWNRDATRRRWAFDYYAASFAAPSSDDILPSEDNA